MTRRVAYVIEPQTLFAPYLEAMFERAGFAVVRSREIDVKGIEASGPDVVFVDVDCFDRGGVTALCKIGEWFATSAAQLRPQVVAYTLSDDPTHRSACYISGATVVCSKSATEIELMAAVTSAVDAATRRDAAARLPKSGVGA